MDFDVALLRDVLAEGGVSPVGHTRRSLIYVCPHCQKPKLSFLKDTGQFVCWHCADSIGFQGKDPEVAVAALLGWEVPEARKLLGIDADTAQLRTTLSLGAQVAPEADGFPVISWPYHYLPLSDPAAEAGVAYLEARGVPAGVAEQYGIRYSPQDQRVGFPVAVDGLLVGYQARTTGAATPKILSSTNIPRNKVLMFEDRLCNLGSSHAVLTEGPVDALKAHLFGGNVAAMGKVVSDSQLDVLVQVGVRKVYLALDPDAAVEMQRLVQRLDSRGLEVYQVDIPTQYKDLGEMSLQDAASVISDATIRVYPWQIF